jgi:hypothetical protein
MPYVPKFVDIESIGYTEIVGTRSRQLVTNVEFRHSNGANANLTASYTNARVLVFASSYNSTAIINSTPSISGSNVSINLSANNMTVTPSAYTVQIDFKRSPASTFETAVVGTLTVLPSAGG